MRAKTLHRRVFDRLLAQVQIPARFQEASFETFTPPTEAATAIGQQAQAFADELPENLETGRSLVIAGSPGTGKTHLGIAIAKAVTQRGFIARYTTALKMTRAVRHGRGILNNGATEEALAPFIEPDLLIIDNLYSESEHLLDELALQEVILDRHDQCRPTVLITDLERGSFNAMVGSGVLDRLAGKGCQVLLCRWDSYRQPAKDNTQPSKAGKEPPRADQ